MWKTSQIEKLILKINALRDNALELEGKYKSTIEKVHPDYKDSARNLIHYLALRRFDLRKLQGRLAEMGLSSLGRSEDHVLATLQTVLKVLSSLGNKPVPNFPKVVSFRKGNKLLKEHTESLFGPSPRGRDVRIMVTLPESSADDYDLVAGLLKSGMNCARINCAHGDEKEWSQMIEHLHRAKNELGLPCKILMDLAGPKMRTGPLSVGSDTLVLYKGDQLLLCSNIKEGKPEVKDQGNDVVQPAQIASSLPEIFDMVKVGEPIKFDDGKIEGIIRDISSEVMVIEITRAKSDGSKLKANKGINLPESNLQLPALTSKDLKDLDFMVKNADIINISFVNSPKEVKVIHDELKKRKAEQIGVMLKIETKKGFKQLPWLLLTAMETNPVGIMIARGDLAVECGWERMAEVQEEILWFCEAAHIPVVWATQVLESLAKKGVPSRAEVTDAAMSQRAECVMLNKGPYILEAVNTLNNILSRMQSHQLKKTATLRSLKVSKLHKKKLGKKN